MSEDIDDKLFEDDQPPPLVRPRRRAWPAVLLTIIILLVVGAGGYVFLNFFNPLALLMGGDRSANASMGADDKAVLTDLLAAQQKAGEDFEALSQSVAGQQEQLKSISDQLAALTSRLESLQAPAPVAQAAAPGVAAPAATIAAAPKAAAKKPPRAPRTTTGPISVGGAPLATAPATGGR